MLKSNAGLLPDLLFHYLTQKLNVGETNKQTSGETARCVHAPSVRIVARVLDLVSSCTIKHRLQVNSL